MSDIITLTTRDYRDFSATPVCYFCGAHIHEVGASFPAGSWERSSSFDCTPITHDVCWRCCIEAGDRIPSAAWKYADDCRAAATKVELDGDRINAALMRYQAASLDVYAEHVWVLDDPARFYIMLARSDGVTLTDEDVSRTVTS